MVDYDIAREKRRMPGLDLKDFIKAHGLVVTIKGLCFQYYNRLKLRRLSLDPSKDHIVYVNDYRMLIIPTDKGISAELAMFNSHEPLTTKVILSRLSKGMICLDVGSNIGYYALLESRIVGKDGKVICIEPSILNFEYLKKNLEMQGQSNSEIYNIAAGDIDSYVDFLIDNQSNLCRVVKENEHISTGNENNENKHKIQNQLNKIPMKRIDTLIEEIKIDKLDFIRMDPEGFESNIYKGMKSTLRRFRPMLFIEFHRMYLGIEGTKNLLLDLRNNEGYESLFYIPRWIDFPIVACTKYIQKITISEVLKRLEKNRLPPVFSLFLMTNRK